MWVLYGYTGLCLFTFRLRRGLALFLREIKNARKGFFKTALFFLSAFAFLLVNIFRTLFSLQSILAQLVRLALFRETYIVSHK